MHVDYSEIDYNRVTAEEVDILLREGEKLAPVMAQTRILRAYAGVRPLVASDNDPSGRNVSRGIVLLDHAERDGMDGFITITGGKLMTYRLMAQWATDAVCRKLGNTAPCVTAEQALPGSQQSTEKTLHKIISLPAPLRGSAITATATAPRSGSVKGDSAAARCANAKPSPQARCSMPWKT